MKLPNEFVVIVDKDHDVQEFAPIEDTVIWQLCKHLDSRDPAQAPHVPLYWNGMIWKEWEA